MPGRSTTACSPPLRTRTRGASRNATRLALRACLSIGAIACIYAAHWYLTYVAAVGLALGDHPNFECWGHTIESGPYRGYCTAAWGWWSVAMYLPEMTLVGAAVAGLVSRSFRVWTWSLGGTAASVIFILIFLGLTHLWALNQMPVIWPRFR